MADVIKNPSHYTGGDIEPKDLILAGCFPHYVASAIEYIWRHKKKNGAEDLRKAAQCLRMHHNAGEESEDYRVYTRICSAIGRAKSKHWEALDSAAGFCVYPYQKSFIDTLETEAKKYEAQQESNHA